MIRTDLLIQHIFHYLYYSKTGFITLMVIACGSFGASPEMSKKLYAECLYNSPPLLLSNIPTTNEEKKEQATQKHGRIIKNLYQLTQRVTRWRLNDITTDIIRGFEDGKKPKYKNLSDDEIWLQQAFHDMRGIEDILHRRDHYNYFGKAPKGNFSNYRRYARASLILLHKEKNKAKEAYCQGRLEIATDYNQHQSIIHVYHMMFHPDKNRPSLKIPYMPCLKIGEASVKKNKSNQEQDTKPEKDQAKLKRYKQHKEIIPNQVKAKGYNVFKIGRDYIIKYNNLPKAGPYKSKILHIHRQQNVSF